MKNLFKKSSRVVFALAACAALSFAACSGGGGDTQLLLLPVETPSGGTTTQAPAVTYTITVGSFENGSVAASATTATIGTTVTLTASPASGYALSSMSVTAADSSAVTLSGSGNTRTFSMPAQNVTVSASFTANYTITVGSIANGTVVASPTSAASGTTVTLTATPASGYVLSSISVTAADSSAVALTGSGNARTFTMPAQNVTVSANFILAYTALPAGTNGTYGTSGTYVTFGSWPQTIKASGVTVNESESKTAGAFTYYKGSDGAWYAKIRENAYRSGYKYSDNTTVAQNSANSYKYFKVEPIKWRVLTNDYSGKKLLLAESVLVNCKYYDTISLDRGSGVYPNNYKESRIRAFLNGLSYNKSGTTNSEFSGKGFLQTAFTTSEQAAIATTAVDNSAASTTDSGGNITPTTSHACADTSDKIFLLSVQEVTKSAYGFAAYDAAAGTRIRKATDYAKASGATQNDVGVGGRWWMRSPSYVSREFARSVFYNGDASDLCDVRTDNGGVVPALSIN